MKQVWRVSVLALSLAIGATGSDALAQSALDRRISAAEQALARGYYSEALSALEGAESHPRGAYLLGRLYLTGDGVVPDAERAFRLLRSAAQSGDTDALHLLGQMYAVGRGVGADPELANQYLREAAESGNAEFQHDYASFLEANQDLGGPQAALDWYRRAAAQDHWPAWTSLGVLHLEGRGVDRDLAQALMRFETAAAAGDARAQNNLGILYSRGEIVEQDYERAAQLYQQAASQGLPSALRNLSVLYENGFGVALDEAFARELLANARLLEASGFSAMLGAIGFRFDPRLVEPDWNLPLTSSAAIAADAGDPVALYETAFRYLQGFGVSRNTDEALRRFEAAVDANFGPAALNLGILYAYGSLVPQDYVRAYTWFAIAAQLGVSEAAELRDALAREMSEDAVRRAQEQTRNYMSGR